MRIPRKIGIGTGAGGINKLEQILNDIAADIKEIYTKVTAGRADIVDHRTKHAALAADVLEIHTKLKAVNAKLDLDAGVTDTNYAATLNPADLTVTALSAQTQTALVTRKTIGSSEA